MNITWTEQDDKNWIGYPEDGSANFVIFRLPSRHYDLEREGVKILKRTSLQKCKDKAEEINLGLAPAPMLDLDNLPGSTKTIDALAKFVTPGAVKILGEIIAWTPQEGSRTVKQVIQALNDAGLSFPVKDLIPRHAFSRACKKLEKDRLIEPCPKHDIIGDVLAYQFTRKDKIDIGEHQEWYYNTEAIVHVNKETGRVYCKDTSIQDKTQALLDNALEAKTAGDITRMVNQLFKKHADLFPIRDQGFAYFVPKEHLGFVSQVDNLLKSLGGKINRFKVADPDGSGSTSVKDAVASGLEVLIQEHEQAIAEFGLTTHAGTLEATAKRIAETRVKIEAYASYLEDRKDDLLKGVDEAKVKLAQRIANLTTEKEWKKEEATTVTFTTVSFKKEIGESPKEALPSM